MGARKGSSRERVGGWLRQMIFPTHLARKTSSVRSPGRSLMMMSNKALYLSLRAQDARFCPFEITSNRSFLLLHVNISVMRFFICFTGNPNLSLSPSPLSLFSFSLSVVGGRASSQAETINHTRCAGNGRKYGHEPRTYEPICIVADSIHPYVVG